MNKNIEQVELSYYQLTFQSFLKESHPELANDTEFITSRGNLAAQTYSQIIKAGQSPNHAEALASEVLYKGLYFSKHDTLVNVLWNEFNEEVPQGAAKNIAQKLLAYCESIFAKYPLSDDFAYEPEFNELYTELTGTIVIWMEEHELQ
jgi:high-affinity Fe2+/Pb2+ permease